MIYLLILPMTINCVYLYTWIPFVNPYPHRALKYIPYGILNIAGEKILYKLLLTLLDFLLWSYISQIIATTDIALAFKAPPREI